MSGGNGPGNLGHPSGQEYNQGEVVALDPSIAPGLARPEGWRVLLGTGLGAWDKFGPLDTDWTPVGSPSPGGGVDKIIPGAGITVSPAAGTGNVTLSQLIAAEWVVDRMRVYAVDAAAGNDANAGFADPTANTQAAFQAASVAAGAVAKKTLAGLAAIFPRSGSGRRVCILIASGTYVGGLDVFLAGCSGYVDGCPLVRGTGTNATAGAVAFSSSNADRTYCGAVTVTGMNAPGYNPTGAATTTSLPCTKVGGGAPGFAGVMAVPLGWRIRFDVATATVALQNQCYQVAEVPNATTLIPQLPFAAAPGATDVFYLEQAGVVVDSYGLDGRNLAQPSVTPQTPTGIQIVGIRSSGTLNLLAGAATFVFSGANVMFAGGEIDIACEPPAFNTAPFYNDPFASWFAGGGLRIEGVCTLGTGNYQNQLGLVVAGLLSVTSAIGLQFLDGCAATSIRIGSSYLGPTGGSPSTPSLPNLGNDTADLFVQPPIVRGANGIRLHGSALRIDRLDIQNATQPAISVHGCCQVSITGVITGVTGNTNVGLDLTDAAGSVIILKAIPTVTGTAGDVRLAGGQIISWAQASFGIADSAGNRIVLLGGVPLADLKFSGTIVGGAAAVFSYLTDAGTGLAANVTVRPGYPQRPRLFMELRVTSVTNNAANAVTVTLYKNGVATAMQATIAAGSAGYTVTHDFAHLVLFADGDTLDLRVDDGAADVGKIVNISASLGYAV